LGGFLNRLCYNLEGGKRMTTEKHYPMDDDEVFMIKSLIAMNQTLRDAQKDKESPKRIAYNQNIMRLNARLSMSKQQQHYYGA